MRFEAFANTSRQLEICFLKTYFLTSGEVKNAFRCICAYFQTIRNMFLKNLFFTIWSGEKRVLVHLRILPDHEKHVFKKLIFYHLERLNSF